MSGVDPREQWQRISRQLQQQGRARFGGAGGGLPKGAGGGIGLLILLGIGAVGVQSALFNVDGGHRAIKYTRLGGVSQKLYPEGESRHSFTQAVC